VLGDQLARPVGQLRDRDPQPRCVPRAVEAVAGAGGVAGGVEPAIAQRLERHHRRRCGHAPLARRPQPVADRAADAVPRERRERRAARRVVALGGLGQPGVG
jgi:hypothetical protein